MVMFLPDVGGKELFLCFLNQLQNLNYYKRRDG
jgi:hypothetical protein